MNQQGTHLSIVRTKRISKIIFKTRPITTEMSMNKNLKGEKENVWN